MPFLIYFADSRYNLEIFRSFIKQTAGKKITSEDKSHKVSYL